MGTSNFYATAAQVIPVLLLTVAIEQRGFRPPGNAGPWAAFIILAILGLFVVAEGLALWGSASGTVFPGQLPLVAGGLATAGLMVLTPIGEPWIHMLLGRYEHDDGAQRATNGE